MLIKGYQFSHNKIADSENHCYSVFFSTPIILCFRIPVHMVYNFFASLICVSFFQPGYHLSGGLQLSWKALASPGPFSENRIKRFTLRGVTWPLGYVAIVLTPNNLPEWCWDFISKTQVIPWYIKLSNLWPKRTKVKSSGPFKYLNHIIL